MDHDNDAFETAALAVADGVASDEQLALLEGDRGKWRRALERLLDETDEHLDVVYGLSGPERDQVVADFEGLMDRLEWSHESLLRILEPERFVKPPPPPPPLALEPEEVRLHASWANGQVVVWAAGRGAPGADNDELADRLEAIGGPPVGWTLHPDISLPDNHRAAALSISVARGPRLAGGGRRRGRPRRGRTQRDVAGPGRPRRRARGRPRGCGADLAERQARGPPRRPQREVAPRPARRRRGRSPGGVDARAGGRARSL